MPCFLLLQAAVERYQKTDPATAALHRCYRGFSRLSVLNERLGLRSGYTKGGKLRVLCPMLSKQCVSVGSAYVLLP